MNFQQLVTFSTVIGEGSMTAAAEKLYLTQPAVSQQIRNLEEEVGAELLVRGARNAKATAQGQILYDYAKRIIALTQQAQVAIQTMGAQIQGTLRIGTLNSVGLYLISPVVGMFLKHNTKLNIKLEYGDGEELIEKLNNDQMDIVILPDAVTEYGKNINGERRLLLKDEMWLVGSGRDAALPSEVDLKHIGERPYVRLTDRYPNFEKILESKFKEMNFTPEPVFETSNVGTLKRVIESGLGWGFLPAHSIKKHVRSGRMTVIEVNDVTYPVNVYLYSSRRIEESKDKMLVEVFYKALTQHVQNRFN